MSSEHVVRIVIKCLLRERAQRSREKALIIFEYLSGASIRSRIIEISSLLPTYSLVSYTEIDKTPKVYIGSFIEYVLLLTASHNSR